MLRFCFVVAASGCSRFPASREPFRSQTSDVLANISRGTIFYKVLALGERGPVSGCSRGARPDLNDNFTAKHGFPGSRARRAGPRFGVLPRREPDAATTKQNRSAGEAPPRCDGGCTPYTPSPSTRFGEVVVRRKGAAGDKDGTGVPTLWGVRFVPDMSTGIYLYHLLSLSKLDATQRLDPDFRHNLLE